MLPNPKLGRTCVLITLLLMQPSITWARKVALHPIAESSPTIKNGMTLRELEILNGKTFTLNGFECDDAGAVCSWQGGNLESSGKTHRWIQLGLTDEQFNNPTNSKLLNAVLGCKCYSSDTAAMQKLNPRVYIIKSK